MADEARPSTQDGGAVAGGVTTQERAKRSFPPDPQGETQPAARHHLRDLLPLVNISLILISPEVGLQQRLQRRGRKAVVANNVSGWVCAGRYWPAGLWELT